MSEYFDQEEFKKNLKKKIAKKSKKYEKVQIRTKSSGFYFLGMVGAAIYFVSHATGFWDGVLGLLKAIVWPAFLVYEAFASLLG
ncbi:MAG: hypothetical protein RLZZ164_638 [Actinomycetota bacterium]|jgi:hypothetical protein